MNMPAFRAQQLVGKRMPRKEDGRLLTGNGQFVDDVRLPGMLHIAYVRSTVARGRITGIDMEAALDVPGVHAIYTQDDLAAVPVGLLSFFFTPIESPVTLLAIVGVFGVLSYTVGQQTTELGIRMALGATASQVQWALVKQGLVPVAVGLGLGISAALLLARFMQTLLFGVTATDTATFAAVIALLIATGTAAAYLPTRRATRLDPVQALRAE